MVPLDSDFLFACPYLHLEDAGTLRFSDEEVQRVREYLLKGGFSGRMIRGALTPFSPGSVKLRASCRRTSIRSSTCRATTPSFA